MNYMKFSRVNSGMTRFNKFDGKIDLINYCTEEIYRGKLR